MIFHQARKVGYDVVIKQNPQICTFFTVAQKVLWMVDYKAVLTGKTLTTKQFEICWSHNAVEPGYKSSLNCEDNVEKGTNMCAYLSFLGEGQDKHTIVCVNITIYT